MGVIPTAALSLINQPMEGLKLIPKLLLLVLEIVTLVDMFVFPLLKNNDPTDAPTILSPFLNWAFTAIVISKKRTIGANFLNIDVLILSEFIGG